MYEYEKILGGTYAAGLDLTLPHVWVSDLILGTYINACLHCSQNTVAVFSSRRQLLDRSIASSRIE